MSDYVEFTGRVETLEWGKSTYTIVRLPDDVAERLAAEGAKRVEGEINEFPVNLAPTRAPVLAETFLWTGRSVLDRIGLAPGDEVEVRLRKAPDDEVETPDDVAAALRAADATHLWEALTPGKRRGLIYQIGTARTQATRDKRIVKLIADIGGAA
jgi:antitoxin component of MazEF toxin-antitoxin module